MRNFLIMAIILTGGFIQGSAQRMKMTTLQMGFDLKMLPPENPEDPGFILEIHSKELFECIDYEIITEKKRSGNNLTIRILGANKPLDCHTGMRPAVARIPFKLEEGEYDLRIVYKVYGSFHGKLMVTGEKRILIDENPDELFGLYSSTLNRMKKGMIWGKIEFRDEGLAELASSLLSKMEANGCQANDLPTGDYGSFYLFENGRQKLRKLSNGNLELPFAYQCITENLETYKQFMREITERSDGKLRISLYSIKGTEFTSWAGN